MQTPEDFKCLNCKEVLVQADCDLCLGSGEENFICEECDGKGCVDCENMGQVWELCSECDGFGLENGTWECLGCGDVYFNMDIEND